MGSDFAIFVEMLSSCDAVKSFISPFMSWFSRFCFVVLHFGSCFHSYPSTMRVLIQWSCRFLFRLFTVLVLVFNFLTFI